MDRKRNGEEKEVVLGFLLLWVLLEELSSFFPDMNLAVSTKLVPGWWGNCCDVAWPCGLRALRINLKFF